MVDYLTTNPAASLLPSQTEQEEVLYQYAGSILGCLIWSHLCACETFSK